MVTKVTMVNLGYVRLGDVGRGWYGVALSLEPEFAKKARGNCVRVLLHFCSRVTCYLDRRLLRSAEHFLTTRLVM
jgi:hypothetical protein